MFKQFVLMMSTASLLSMFNHSLIDSAVLRLAIYALMVFYVFWVVSFTYKYVPKFYQNKAVIALFIFVVINIIVSPYSPLYARIIKFVGYLGSFAFGYVVCKKRIPFKCNKWILASLFLLPLILVGLFDKTPHKTIFFELSNPYSFFGLCLALFLYTIFNDRKYIFIWSIGLLLAYIISASSLGIVTSVVLSVLIINRRKKKLMYASVLFAVVSILAVIYIDIPIFVRIRDVINIATSLSWDDWCHLKDMNFYELTQKVGMESERSDNASFLWRLAHWQFIIDGVIENWWYALPFGLGDNYANEECGNYCHNEYLKFFAENGLVVFGIIISWIKKVHASLEKMQAYYFILAALCYHLTENLIDTFVACVLMYFCIGYWMCKAKMGNTRKRKLYMKLRLAMKIARKKRIIENGAKHDDCLVYS